MSSREDCQGNLCDNERMHLRCTLAWAVLALLPRAAAGADVISAAVRVGHDEDRALFERLRGQTSDMNVHLMVAPYRELEANLQDQLAAADTAAATLGAQAVIYWSHLPGQAWELYMVQAARGRVLVRQLADSGELPSSATLETAALVVRGALQALSAGITVGLERKDLPQPPPPPPLVSPPLPAQVSAPPASPAESSAPVRRFALVSALLATGWLDGQSPHGQAGGEVRVGLARDRFSFGILGLFGPGADLTDSLATVHSARQLAAAWARGGLSLAKHLRMDLGLRAGVAMFTRRTTATSVVVQAMPPSTEWSAVAGAELALQWKIEWLGVVAGVGCDYLATPPSLGYRAQDSFVRPRPFSHLAPYVILGVAYVPGNQREMR